jgi:fatty acid desaturase
MTTLRQEIAEYRISLDKRAQKYKQYFGIATVGLSACLTAAFLNGSAGGWPWLLGAFLFLFGGLWSLVEARHTELLSAIQALPVAIKLVSESK